MYKHKWFRMCDQWRKMLVAIYYDAAAVSEEIAAALFYFPESSRLQCVFPPLVVDDLRSQDTHPHCSRQNSLNWPDAKLSTFLVAIFEIPSVSFLRLRGGGQLNYPRRHPSGNYCSEQADKQTTTWRFNFWEQARSFIQTSSSCQEFQPQWWSTIDSSSKNDINLW